MTKAVQSYLPQVVIAITIAGMLAIPALAVKMGANSEKLSTVEEDVDMLKKGYETQIELVVEVRALKEEMRELNQRLADLDN
jgi:Tfp pilus assembly protein PilO